MKAWRSVMEEWEQTAKQIKTNAEILESVCQDKLTQLYQDKRKARKAYHEEHNKIATQFTNVSQTTNIRYTFILLVLAARRTHTSQAREHNKCNFTFRFRSIFVHSVNTQTFAACFVLYRNTELKYPR